MKLKLPFLLVIAISFGVSKATAQSIDKGKPEFKISFPASANSGPLTGRMFLIIARANAKEPRFQVGRYGTQFFGVDFEKLEPSKEVTIDGTVLGYPINDLKNIPPGDYYVQAVLDKYTEFKRSDGHTLWMHNDQWEGQDWRVSPGNLYSAVQKISINQDKSQSVKLETDMVMPAIKVPEDTKWVKHIKIKSELLSKFWGQSIYLGATILLPNGYDENPNKHYPTIYQEDHFSLAAPFWFT
jgi:hypothetical protein